MANITVTGSDGQTAGKSKQGATLKRAGLSTKISYLSKLCDQLEKAAEGLVYPYSESVESYQFFSLHEGNLAAKGDKLSAMEFLSGVGLSQGVIDEFKIPIDKFIEEKTLDDFFPAFDDVNKSDSNAVVEARQYAKLKTELRKRLLDVKVFRVGKADVRCYIAGFTKLGNIAGLVTTCIET